VKAPAWEYTRRDGDGDGTPGALQPAGAAGGEEGAEEQGVEDLGSSSVMFYGVRGQQYQVG